MTSQHMTNDPFFLGIQYGLGTHRATYKLPTVRETVRQSIISLVIFIVCIIGIGLTVRITSGHIDSSNLSAFIVVLLGSIALMIFFAMPTWYIRKAIQNRTLGLFVYDDGLIYGVQASRKVIPWQDVQAVWHKVIVTYSQYGSSSSRHIYTISCNDGTKVTIGKLYQFKGMEQIGHLIETETARYLFPAALNRYQLGQPVVFGSLTVTQEGLSYRSQMLLWSEVKIIQIGSGPAPQRFVTGRILIRKQGKRSAWASIKLVDVPNAEVFKQLVQDLAPLHSFTLSFTL